MQDEPTQVRLIRVQLELPRRGRWPYALEGLDNPPIREALRAFQHDEHLLETSMPDDATLGRLGVTAR